MKKLLLVGVLVAFPHKKYTHYYYGRLRITVNNDNVIIGIKNHTNNKTKIDEYKKKILNEVLNIIWVGIIE